MAQEAVKIEFDYICFGHLVYICFGQFEFDVAMESIHFLNEVAYDYLANIPSKHWSRHAFTPN